MSVFACATDKKKQDNGSPCRVTKESRGWQEEGAEDGGWASASPSHEPAPAKDLFREELARLAGDAHRRSQGDALSQALDVA